ncbi:MAG: zinc-ribbon domain-containing protein [Candidatus Mcinerneyibacterium aminivorans]|uniref:Zinc-ribbon domain-containing protein n=1 Tax=Candidatus Mcinerneyibacterium aminivorans TaxID=2703815 RepID=A0A5D0MJA2_9BACT|nr:MAG: zinc-ribbon domain-containing protein [Candidatus Mcinerneyibacterium aminivorans]
MGVVVFIWILFGIAAGLVGSSRGGNGCLYFLAGFLLGPIGLITAFFEGKRCPRCQKKISNNAMVCPYCSYEFKSEN